jgi:phosphatidate cytidylyltransferase
VTVADHVLRVLAGGNQLLLRVASAVVLAPLAVAAAYIGGFTFAAFWGIAAIGVLWEWTTLVAAGERLPMRAAAMAVVLALVLATLGHSVAAVLVLALGAITAAALGSRERRIWVAAGVPYAGAIGVAPVVLRSDDADGFLAIIFLFAIVWTADVAAYFVGRALGGPKLLPRVSPKKTWSGAFGGIVAAMIVAVAFAGATAPSGSLALALLAGGLSIVAQAGDLFESFLKRRFGAKDSSQLIPGHGGLMDRLDGFVAAGVVSALIGLGRGGFEAPGRGLLAW